MADPDPRIDHSPDVDPADGGGALEENLARARREREAAYDELRSTTTALEATNRELQATNEALERTNVALQAANTELDASTSELRSSNEGLEATSRLLGDQTREMLLAQASLDSVLSSMHEGVIVVDRTLRVVSWNRRVTELWGLRDDRAEGKGLLELDIGIPVDGLRDPIRQVLAGSSVDELELDGRDRRGHAVLVRIAIAPLQNRPEAGEPDGVILLVSAERPD